jgi:anti-sigma factor (TIGR02949 family)
MSFVTVDCEQVLTKLESFCDREVSRWDRWRIQRHLAECDECLDRKEFRVTLQRVIREKCGRAELPPALIERIRRSLGETS